MAPGAFAATLSITRNAVTMTHHSSRAKIRLLVMVAALVAGAAEARGVAFVEAADLIGIRHRHAESGETLEGLDQTLGAGVCVFDADGDGWEDVLFVAGSGTSRRYGRQAWWQPTRSHAFYRNEGGHLRLIADAFPPGAARGASMGCAASDLDLDGDVDVVVTARGPDVVYRNDGRGKFTPQGELPGAEDWSTSVVALPLDDDALPDLVVARYVRYARDARTFEAQTGYEPGIDPAFDVALYDRLPNTRYRNLGDLAFEHVPEAAGSATVAAATLALRTFRAGATLGEANEVGGPSRFIALDGNVRSLAEAVDFDLLQDTGLVVIARPTGAGLQARRLVDDELLLDDRDVTDHAWDLGLNRVEALGYTTWSLASGDFDGDGDTDLFLARGAARPSLDTRHATAGQPNALMLREGDAFDATIPSSVHRSSRGAVAVDLDHDGRLDLVISNNNDVPTVLLNRGAAPAAWLSLDLGAETTRPGERWCAGPPFDACLDLVGGGFLGHGPASLRFTAAATATGPIRIERRRGSARRTWQLTSNATYRMHDGEPTVVAGVVEDTVAHALLTLDTQARRALLDLLMEQRPEALHTVAVGEALWTQPALRSRFVERFEARPGHALLPLAHGLLYLDIAKHEESARADVDALLDGLLALEDDSSTAILIALLSRTEPSFACSVAHVLERWYREEEAAIQTKGLALPALLRASAGRDGPAARCALRAVAESESPRAMHALLDLLTTSTDPLTTAEAVRTLGWIRQTGARAALEHQRDTSTDAAVVGEAFLALAKLDRRRELPSLDALVAASGRVDAAAVLAHLFAHDESTVFDRTELTTLAHRLLASHGERLGATPRLELAIRSRFDRVPRRWLDESDVDTALRVAYTGHAEASLDPSAIARLVDLHPASIATLDDASLRAIADTIEPLDDLLVHVSAAQRRTLAVHFASTRPTTCLTHDLRAPWTSLGGDRAELACLDFATAPRPGLIAAVAAAGAAVVADASLRESVVERGYRLDTNLGRAIVAALVRSDPARAADVRVEGARVDARLLAEVIRDDWPRLDLTQRHAVLGAQFDASNVDFLRSVTADATAPTELRIAALTALTRMTTIDLDAALESMGIRLRRDG